MGSFPHFAAPRVKTAPLPTVRFDTNVPADAFGVKFGLTLQQSGALLGRRVREMAEEDARRESQKALTGAYEEGISYLHGTGTKPGVLQLKGEDAIGSAPASVEVFRNIGEKWGKNLSPRAAARFAPQWSSQSASFFGSVSKRESGQRVVAGNDMVTEAQRVGRKMIGAEPFNEQAFDDATLHIMSAMVSNNASEAELLAEKDALDLYRYQQKVPTLLRLDPHTVMREMRDPQGMYSDDMTLVERESYIAKAARRIEELDSDALRIRTARDKKEKEDRDEVEDKAHRTMELQFLNDTADEAAFKILGPDLSKADFTTYRQYIDHGDPVNVNTETQFELGMLAATVGVPTPDGTPPLSMEEFSSMVSDAVNNREIPAKEGIQLRKEATDARFKDALLHLNDTIDALQRAGDTAGAYRGVNALTEFRAWKHRHPDATYEEAMAEATDLSLRYSRRTHEDLLKRPSTQPLPHGFVKLPNGKGDWGKSAAQLDDYWVNVRHRGDRAAAMADPEFIKERDRLQVMENLEGIIEKQKEAAKSKAGRFTNP